MTLRTINITFILSVVLAISCFSLGCGTNIHSTLVLYDRFESGRLPPDSVARILMADAIEYGVSIARFDDVRGLGARDTVEISPGPHRMWLTMGSEEPLSRRSTTTTHETLHKSYLYFEFISEAGHLYDLTVTGFTPSDWRAELVDRAETVKPVRGVHTTRLE